MPHFTHAARLATGVLALASLAACATSPRTGGDESLPEGALPRGKIITQADILRTGATDAFEVIERGGTHLLITRPGRGKPAQLSHRGTSTIYLDNAVLLVVDDIQVDRHQETLRSIPADAILFIQVLSGHEASAYWGSRASNGVVLVRTSAR